jgi:hypothetical protein
MTMVDLGDTSHCLTMAPLQQPRDGSHGLVENNVSRLGPIFDLKQRSKRCEQGGNQNDLKVELGLKDEPSVEEVCDDTVLSQMRVS